MNLPPRRAVSPSIALFLLFVACSGGKPESAGKGAAVPDVPAYGDAIVEGSIGDVSGFLSAVTSDSASHAAAGYVFNGLVRYDKDLKLEGALAKSWEISPDGKKITFHLRRNVKWQDGAPFTSSDVMFTYQRMIDPNTPTAYGDAFKQVKRASAPDPFTFVAEYARPFAPALE
ncbi:MAG: ABC transporter substrate-binding protein, partial [Desulfobacteria bacterium]